MSQKRTIILEPQGGEAPTEQLLMELQALVGTLMIVGGEFTVRADRVKIGELPGPLEPCQKCDATGVRDYGKGPEECRSCDGDGRREGRADVLSETAGFFIEWRGVPKLSDEPLTARVMDAVMGEGPPRVPEPGPERDDEPESGLASTDEIRAALEGAGDDEPGEEPEEEQ